MQVYGVSIPGSILHPQQKAFQAALSTAKRLGANVASHMGKPFDEAKYLGDIDGACPICHLDAITLNGKDGLDHCTTCGAWGKLVFEKGKEGRGRLDLKGQPVTSVITMEGKRRHMVELNEIRSNLEANPGIWKREHEKFREMDRFLLKL